MLKRLERDSKLHAPLIGPLLGMVFPTDWELGNAARQDQQLDGKRDPFLERRKEGIT